MRYQGQGYEVSVEVKEAGSIDSNMLSLQFEEAYLASYGRTLPDVDVEILSWTLSMEEESANDKPMIFDLPQSEDYFDLDESVLVSGGSSLVAPVFWRGSLSVGVSYEGPLLVTENQTTTVVPKGSNVTLLENGLLEINLGYQ